MSSERAFRIPRAHKDRLHPRQLVAIAATCLSVGVALSGVLQAAQLPHEASSEPPAPFDLDAVETSFSAATVMTPLALPLPLPLPLPIETQPMATPKTAPVSAAPEAQKAVKTAKPRLVRGALTYRCDAPDRAGPKSEACPHDHALEARVWRVLARLATCRGTAATSGRADLRLWFGPGTATRAVFAAPTISPSLNLRAVSQCVARDISKLRATRKADRFELSLGIELAGPN